MQITFRDVSARLEQEPLSLPDSALALAACDGSELTALDDVEQDDVGHGRDCFVCLVLIHFDIQAKGKVTHLRGRNRRGDGPCTPAMRSEHEADEVKFKNLTSRLDVTRLLFNMYKKNCKYVGFKPKSCACIPGVVLHVRLSRGSHGFQPLL